VWTVEYRGTHRAQDAAGSLSVQAWQTTLLSSAENQTCDQADEFGAEHVEDWRCGGPRGNMRFGWKSRSGHGPHRGPRGQATAHENAAPSQVLASCVRLDYLSTESFVGFDGSLWNG
jgi:hypothetical protein